MDDKEITEGYTLAPDHQAEAWSFPDFINFREDAVVENELHYHNEFQLGAGKEFIMEGIYIWYGKFRSQTQKPMPVANTQPHVQMFFCLGNSMAYRNEAKQKPFAKFRNHQHNMLLLPPKNMYVEWQPEEDNEAFAINISTDFLFNNLAKGNTLQTQFQNAIKTLVPTFLSQRHMPLTPRVISVLFEILNSDYSGHQKGLFIKAKVIELIALQFDQYEQLPASDLSVVLNEADTIKMQHARDILIGNLESSLSLKDLAHQVGTNEFNLKKKFKILFGDTVFGYQHKFRMEQARTLLYKEENKIAEVAQLVGYKHATHFTAAFKKHFGYLPNKIRLSLLYLIQPFASLTELALELGERGAALLI